MYSRVRPTQTIFSMPISRSFRMYRYAVRLPAICTILSTSAVVNGPLLSASYILRHGPLNVSSILFSYKNLLHSVATEQTEHSLALFENFFLKHLGLLIVYKINPDTKVIPCLISSYRPINSLDDTFNDLHTSALRITLTQSLRLRK